MKSLLALGLGTLAVVFGPIASVTASTPVAVIERTASNKADGALADKLQGKPVIVDIYAEWCSKCKKVAPTLSELKEEYEDKVNFVVLNVTNRSTTQASSAKAEKLGLTGFFNSYKAQTGTVAILDPATGKALKVLRGNNNVSAYTAVLDKAIADMANK